MTRSNRPLNRLIIALIALVLIAGGGYVLARRAGAGLPGLPQPSVDWLWGVGAASVVLIVLSLAWVFTRGRGRISHLLVLPDSEGPITIDTRVAADLVEDALSDNQDVVAVNSTGFRMRGSAVLSLRVTARRGADLDRLVSSVGDAVEQLDQVLEQRFPVLLQVVSGARASLAREHRTR